MDEPFDGVSTEGLTSPAVPATPYRRTRAGWPPGYSALCKRGASGKQVPLKRSEPLLLSQSLEIQIVSLGHRSSCKATLRRFAL